MSTSMPAPKQDADYERRTGAKLRLVQPSSAINKFDFMKATGALEVEIAHFGRFQTGTSIQAPLFFPPVM